jgi:hypothetical protein
VSSLAKPPTPALVQAANVKGTPTNVATVVIDPSLAQISVLKKNMSADDTAFWSAVTANLAKASPPPEPDDFITSVSALSGFTRLNLDDPGRNPVAEADFNTAYDSWDKAGQPWDPADGDGTNDVLALSQSLVSAALPAASPPFLKRFWTLETMARMLAHALPDDGSTTKSSP